MADTDVGEIASAAKEVAKLGQQALQTGEKAGGFFARVFKEPVEAGVGIITDRIRLMRLRRWDAMADEVEEILTRRGVTDTRAVPPKLGLPLLEEAALEEEPELQKLWSRLLANAMDPAFTNDVRVAYTEIIKNLTALDARVLFLIYNSVRAANALDFGQAEHRVMYENQICQALGIGQEEYSISIDNLLRVRCVAPHFARVELSGSIKASGGTKHLTSYSGSEAIVITPLGIRFVEACTDVSQVDEPTVRAHYNFTHRIDVSLNLPVVGL